tara:strand:+ start:84 stop:341 length:258 start_codon:yes stop_codon:yes gene_type:complete
MKFKVLLVIIFCSFANFANAEEVFFTNDRCSGLKSTIENLILLSDGQWGKLLTNPSDKGAASELSWTINLAENYSSLYSVFCAKN